MLSKRCDWPFIVVLAASFFSTGCNWRLPNMQDDGGTWLFYEVESDAWKTAGDGARQSLLSAVLRRVDSKGRLGIAASIDDENRLKVSIPSADEKQIERVRTMLGNSGQLESTVGSRGRITGKFTKAEVDKMVDSIQAATLPFPLSKEPVEEIKTSH